MKVSAVINPGFYRPITPVGFSTAGGRKGGGVKIGCATGVDETVGVGGGVVLVVGGGTSFSGMAD